MTRKLKTDPKQTPEINFGETDIVVPPDGIVDVPDDVADALIQRGGFTEVLEPEPTVTAPAPAAPEAPAADDPATSDPAPTDPAAAADVAPAAPEAAAPAPKSNLARLKGTPNSSATVAGTTYDADAEGNIEVPVFAVETLLSHGFVVGA